MLDTREGVSRKDAKVREDAKGAALRILSLFFRHLSHSQPQRVQLDEAFCIALVVYRVAFKRRELF
jgi:hypothetical protein